MPRAKVKDVDRQRATRACVFCKSSKLRCDSRLPCARCIKQNRASSCRYVNTVDNVNQLSHTTAVGDDGEARRNVSTRSRASQRYARLRGDPDHEQRQNGQVDDQPLLPSPQSPEQTQSRILISAKGERVFVGEIATLSFLQFLRKTLRFHAGPSKFSEPPTRHVMLEAEIRGEDPSGFREESLIQREELVQCYLEATSGIFYLYNEDEIRHLLDSSNSGTHEPQVADDAAALSLLIAIGAQCRNNENSDAQSAAHHFIRARNIAFEDMVSDPTINMIRIFLLLAFYLLGACRRNAAFMYLGIAGKAACALGLHRSGGSKRLSFEQRELRLRVWKSLAILDTIVSSVLGRPSSLPDVHIRNDTERDLSIATSEDTSKLAFKAAYGACTHLFTVLKRVSDSNHVDPSFAESFLADLRHWSNELPEDLRNFASSSTTEWNPSLSGASGREKVIGNVHVACLYYFAVMLITRPFLISHFVSRIRRKNPQMEPDPVQQERVANLAQVCVDGGICMAKIAKSAMEAGDFFGNMCLIKALVFAVGLPLGFALFADRNAPADAVHEIQTALQDVRDVLRYFSRQSPQAQLYYEILTDFSEAIQKHQQQFLQNRKQRTSQFIDQSFTVGIDSKHHDHHPTGVADWEGTQNGVPSQYQSSVTSSNPPPSMPIVHNMDAEALYGTDGTGINWTDTSSLGSENIMQFDDHMNLPLFWDDFSIDWQNFAFPGMS